MTTLSPFAVDFFQNAGYNTGAFGKWHLGDYGEYLPTNQGFDYFYGSHHVNDMTPFYHVTEEDDEYEIVHGYDELEDQSMATKWIHEEITEWVTDVVTNSDEPFFAYYASPWPHGPVFAGDDLTVQRVWELTLTVLRSSTSISASSL